MKKHDWTSVEVQADAFSTYNASIHAKLGDSVWPGFTWQFRQQTRSLDAAQYLCESQATVAEPGEPAVA